MAIASRADDASDCDSDGSSLLSSPSATPSPPPELRQKFASLLPTPPQSQDSSQTGSPSPDDSSTMNSDKDGPPPRKRRRISERAPRTTEYLDLRNGKPEDPDEQLQLARLLDVLHTRQKIVVVAGAGISVSAGIPDFRSSTGLFTSLRAEHNLKGGSGKDLFDASVVYKDASATKSFHDMVRGMSKLTKEARPTLFHQMLATLSHQDRLLRLYSQNVDGIDTSLKPLATATPLVKDESGKWPRTVQLHGGLDKMVCSKCHDVNAFDPESFEGSVPAICPKCEEMNRVRTEVAGKRSHGVGMLRPRMVLYNEHNPDDEAIGSVTRDDLRKRPDAVIVVGTTLKVPGVKRIVKEMCATVRDRRGGVAIWINNDPEPSGKEFEDCWDIVVRAKCDDVARYAALGRWDHQDDFREVTQESRERAEQRTQDVRVEIDTGAPLRFAGHAHHNPTFKQPPGDKTPCRSPKRPCSSPISSHGNSVYVPDSFDSDVPVEAPETPCRRQSKTPARQIPKSSKKSPAKSIAKMAIGSLLSGSADIAPAVQRKTVKHVKSNPKATAAKTASKPAPARKRAAPKKIKQAAKKPAQVPINETFKAKKAGTVSAAGKDAKADKVMMNGIPNLTMQPIAPVDARNNSLSSPLPPICTSSPMISDSEDDRKMRAAQLGVDSSFVAPV